ncbi:MAG: hypothetical protein EBR82_56240 [Caulobacteraceae bacterium]|nr:hypothetical protein [Caulobacteraceae bacterium]
MDSYYPSNREVESALIDLSWRAGDLRYKFKPAQLKMFNDIYESKNIKYVVKCARRLGKTYLLCCIAVMQCLNRNGAMVRFAAPTSKALKKFIIPIMNAITSDCPDDLKPQFKESQNVYQFYNGSEIHLAGVNNDNADSLRGTFADLFIIDEAGFVDNLKYLIDDVAFPQFLDPNGTVVKGRRLIISSSPAKTPAHEFTEIAQKAEAEGCYSHFDIYWGGYPKDTIEMYKQEVGGEDSTTWKREYLALDVVDENYALVPEWKDTFASEVVPDDRFQFYQKYVALDIGVRDLTCALFAYYDFSKACLFVMDEVVMNGPQMTTERLALAVKEKETSTFRHHKVHRRVSDVELLLLNDLRALHNLYFSPTDKGRLEEMINEVRIWVNAGRVIIDPKCEHLLGCMRYGVWNEARTEFDRSVKYGHFDGLAALMYLIRNIDTRTNPIPIGYGKTEADYFFTETEQNSNKQAIKKMLGIK